MEITDIGLLLTWRFLFLVWEWSIIPLIVLSVAGALTLELLAREFQWSKDFWIPVAWIATLGWIAFFIAKGLGF